MNNAIQYPGAPGERLPDQPTPQPQRKKEKILYDERGLIDLPFLLLTVLLVLIGVVMMFSASFASAYAEEGSSTAYFARQGLFAVVGIGIMLFVSRLNYQMWRALSFPIMAGTIFLLMLVPIFGTKENGARRWIYLGFTSFQPSEIAKLAVILTFSTLMSAYKDRMKTFRYGVVPFAAILGAIALLLALEPHFSAIIIIFCVGGVMMFLGGTELKWFGIALIAAALFGFIYLKFMSYASARITAWQDPWADASDDGYQIVQSLYAIGSGGLMGLGLGKGRQKYQYLPEEHNDYIFAIVCEELGFVGAMVVILLFVLLILRGYWIAIHARDRFGALMVGGLTTLLALQVFFNIGVVTNFLPATGISLPFFSYGGTALLLQLFEMGLVLSVSRQSNNKLL